MSAPPSPTDAADDLLGLDQQIKLTKRAKIAKIDQDRLMGPNGVQYVAKNYHKLTRIFAKHDRALAKRTGKSLSSAQKRSLKYDNEFDNLSAVLNFYQLWCHTLFPKANFADCARMIRGVTNRAPLLKIYRRELLDQEIMKMKVKSGIVDVPAEGTGEAAGVPDGEAAAADGAEGTAGADGADDDDWSFMNQIAPNPLFVDEELYTTPPESGPPEPEVVPQQAAPQAAPQADSSESTAAQSTAPAQTATTTSTTTTTASASAPDDFDGLDDDDFYSMAQTSANDEDYQLQLMNEMDL